MLWCLIWDFPLVWVQKRVSSEQGARKGTGGTQRVEIGCEQRFKRKDNQRQLLYYVSLIRACMNFDQFDHQLVYLGPRICVVQISELCLQTLSRVLNIIRKRSLRQCCLWTAPYLLTKSTTSLLLLLLRTKEKKRKKQKSKLLCCAVSKSCIEKRKSLLQLCRFLHIHTAASAAARL